jgi:hypothetical protein
MSNDEITANDENQFPLLTGTPEALERELKRRESKAKLRVMKIGETISLSKS